ncbi:MAG: type II secretion system F family protein, partial [Candidatus Eremiobacterota bacterium]
MANTDSPPPVEVRGRVSTEVLSTFFRRLQAMVASGIPVHNAINFLCVEENPVLAATLERVAQRIYSGSSLSNALREHPRIFPRLATDLIQAGETSGRLDRVLSSLADYLERSARLQRKIMAALTYPSLLLLLTFLIVGVLVVFVFPREQEMATSLGAEVPALTRWLSTAMMVVSNPLVLTVGFA